MDSFRWIVILKQERRTLLLSFWWRLSAKLSHFFLLVYWFDWKDPSNPGAYPLAHLIFKNSASIPPLQTQCPICILLILDMPCLCGTCCFCYCDSCTRKAFKVYLCNLIETLLTTKLDWWHFCIKLWRLPSYVRFVTTICKSNKSNKQVSSCYLSFWNLVSFTRWITELELYFIRLYFFYQYRQYRRGGGVRLFVKESFCCKTKLDFSIKCDAIESLCLELANEKSKNNSNFDI